MAALLLLPFLFQERRRSLLRQTLHQIVNQLLEPAFQERRGASREQQQQQHHCEGAYEGESGDVAAKLVQGLNGSGNAAGQLRRWLLASLYACFLHGLHGQG